MVEASLTVCPECEKETLRRVIDSVPGIAFKGSGFYVTDSRGSGSAPKTEPVPAPKTDAKTKGKSDAKSDTASETKIDSSVSTTPAETKTETTTDKSPSA